MTPRRWLELGLVVGIFGALMVAAGGSIVLRGHTSDGARRRERLWVVSGSVVIAIGFGLQLAAQIAR